MKKRILVIDDEELLTKTFARLLEKRNFDVLVASHPDDALAMIEEEKFDLVLCDIRMPGKNGIETMLEIRSLLQEKGIAELPVIFLTGFADEESQRKATSLRPIAYISKPFDTLKLLGMIESTLAAA